MRLPAGALHPRIPPHTLHRMVAALQRLHHDANVRWVAEVAGTQQLSTLQGSSRRCLC